MDRLKKKWRSMYLMDQIFLLIGVVGTIACLIGGELLYAVIFMVIMWALAVSISSNRTKRLGRQYGTLFFHVDGETVPLTFEQVKAEYMHGQSGKYSGCQVTVCFPYDKMDETGNFKTGFGLTVRKDGWQDEGGLLPTLKKGELISATGKFVAVNPKYFCIGKLESVVRATIK